MKTIVGLAASHQDAEELIRELTDRGFKIEDLVRVGERPGRFKQDCEDEIFHTIEEFFGAEEKPEVKDLYEEGLKRGGVLVSVFAEDEDIDLAAEIMIRRGVAEFGEKIDSQVFTGGKLRIYDHSGNREAGRLSGFRSPG